MPAPRRNRLDAEDAERSRSRAMPARLHVVDTRELTTGAFVVGMALLGSKLSPHLFADASKIVVTQVVFELPMALLAVCAGKAISQPTRGRRAAYLGAGLALVAAAGISTAFDVGAPSMIIGGLWLILARAVPPHGCAWFSAEHCRAIEVTASTAWACLIGGLLLLWLLSAIAPPRPAAQTSPGFVYAIAWGCYYLALAFVLPNVRRRSRRRQSRSPRGFAHS